MKIYALVFASLVANIEMNAQISFSGDQSLVSNRLTTSINDPNSIRYISQTNSNTGFLKIDGYAFSTEFDTLMFEFLQQEISTSDSKVDFVVSNNIERSYSIFRNNFIELSI